MASRDEDISPKFAIFAESSETSTDMKNNIIAASECGATYRYRVEPRDVDHTCRARIVSMADYILDTAGEDAEQRGFGVRSLFENGSTWVLSRFAVELDRLPGQYETFDVRTWVSSFDRLLTTRNFELYDARGERMGAAVSNWVMLDLKSRRPMDLRGRPEYERAIIPEPSPVEAPRRLAAVEGSESRRHRVAYSDVDFNCHMNSMRYLSLMIDMLPLETLTSQAFRRFDMNFLHESRFGEDLVVACEHGAGIDRFEIRKADGTAACRADVAWR